MFQTGKFEDMLVYCKKLLENDPKDMMGLQNTALSLIHLERFDEAIFYCNKVLEIKNYDTYALKNKIYALEKQKKFNVFGIPR